LVGGSVTIANSGGITSSGTFSVTGNLTQNSSGSFTDNGTVTVGSADANQVFILDGTQSLPEGTYIVIASSNDKIYNYKLILVR